MLTRLVRLLSWAGMYAVLVVAVGCSPIQYNYDLVGKVVDDQTGSPIPGTVILRVWNKSYGTLAGSHGEYYDAAETVADANGDFIIPGKGLLILSNITKGGAYVFKAGYDWVVIDYESLQNSRGVVKLQKIGKELMSKKMPPIPDGPLSKRIEYMKEINIVEMSLGRRPYKLNLDKYYE